MQLVNPEFPLKTARCILEPLQAFHALLLYNQLQRHELYTYIPEDPLSLEALTARYQRLSTRLSPDGEQVWLNWAVRLQDRQEYIGLLQATVYPESKAEIAYIYFPAYWSKGYALEGCTRVLQHLAQDYHINRVQAQIDTRNQASIQLIERLGFQRIATQLQADSFKGSVSDEYHYERFLHTEKF